MWVFNLQIQCTLNYYIQPCNYLPVSVWKYFSTVAVPCCQKKWIIDYYVPQQSWLLIPIRVNYQCWQFISIQLIVEQHNCTSNFTTTYSFVSLLSKFIDIYERMCDANEMCHLILFKLCLLLRGQSEPSKGKWCT